MTTSLRYAVRETFRFLEIQIAIVAVFDGETGEVKPYVLCQLVHPSLGRFERAIRDNENTKQRAKSLAAFLLRNGELPFRETA